MNPDLTELLRQWPYHRGRVSARIVTAEDGRQVVQMRVDLGILQMEISGRPDGERPGGLESWLEYYLTRLTQRASGPPAEEPEEAAGESPDVVDGLLSTEACRRLRAEAVQFHHRYLALFALERYEEVVRDTSHNLAIIGVTDERAQHPFDREIIRHFLPHTLMVRARASALLAVGAGQTARAIEILDAALGEIRAVLAEDAQRSGGEAFSEDESAEIQLLEAMRDSLVPKFPPNQRSELTRRLSIALANENYELAAILRDELKNLDT